jgi:hypothetical protein
MEWCFKGEFSSLRAAWWWVGWVFGGESLELSTKVFNTIKTVIN